MYDYMFHQWGFINPLFGEGLGRMIFIRKCQPLKSLKWSSSRKHTGAWFLGNFTWRVYSRYIRNSHTHTHTCMLLFLLLCMGKHKASPSTYIKASEPHPHNTYNLLTHIPFRLKVKSNTCSFHDGRVGRWLLSASKDLYWSDFLYQFIIKPTANICTWGKGVLRPRK